MVNDSTAVVAPYATLFIVPASAVAVIVHLPAPVVAPVAVPVVPLTLHGPEAAKVTPIPEEEVAYTENPLPYCTPANCERLIVWVCVLWPEDRIVKDPDTELAAS